MALIKCKECGHEVSDKASTCPNCGYPIGYSDDLNVELPKSKRSKLRKTLLYVLSFLIVCSIGVGLYYLYTLRYSNKNSVSVNEGVDTTSILSEDETRKEQERLAEEEISEQQEHEEKKPDWIQGTWVYTSSYGLSKVVINGDNIAVYMDGNLVYDGSYEIRDGNLYYNYGAHGSDYIILDNNSQRLKADESTYFSKAPSSSTTSNSNRESVYSSNEGRTAYMEVLQLQKEVRALIDKSAPYRSIMQSTVYGSYEYQVASIQNNNILNAAIQKQEKALRIARNKLHDESLIRELSGQLETLNKAKYSD